MQPCAVCSLAVVKTQHGSNTPRMVSVLLAAMRADLPQKTDRPPATPALNAFWKAISDINDFYWCAHAGFHALKRLRPATAIKPADFIEPKIAAHLNISLVQFERRLDEQPLRLHYLCVVDAVTFYEEFLFQTLVRELPKRPGFNSTKPLDRQAKKVIDGSYERRPEDIDRALGITVTTHGTEHGLVLDDLKAAFLARNCIVHAGGVVSARELPRFVPLIGSLKAGDKLLVDEALWRRFCHALFDHAQDVDLLTRIRP